MAQQEALKEALIATEHEARATRALAKVEAKDLQRRRERRRPHGRRRSGQRKS